MTSTSTGLASTMSYVCRSHTAGALKMHMMSSVHTPACRRRRVGVGVGRHVSGMAAAAAAAEAGKQRQQATSLPQSPHLHRQAQPGALPDGAQPPL